MILFHDERSSGYSLAGHPERPARITQTVPFLRERHPEWKWREPEPATDEIFQRGHTIEHIERIRTATANFDGDTPTYPNIFDHAARATGAAVAAGEAALRGEAALSLMRPPGHHATRSRAMGFCYFSHIALGALHALDQGVARVAVWDFDAHHGNGTEDIVARHPQIAFASIHQFPGYPGTGTRSFGNVTNFPIAPMSDRAVFMTAAKQGLEKLLDFQPEILLVSAGFDAFAGDPITQMTLEPADFATFGSWLREIAVPTAAILEGGYSDQLPELIETFLASWSAGMTQG